MSLGRTCVLTGAFVDSQQHPLASGVLTWQLVVDNPGGAPVVYQVTGDPANGEFVLPVSFTTTLDISGTLGAGVPVTAPQDLQLNIAGVLTPTTAYYLITGPDGISFTTMNFAYSASARDIGTVSSNSAPVTYTQAAVTFRVATPQELGISVQVVATLSDQCTLTGFDGVLILPGTEFTTQLDGAGVGTLLLAPNDPVHGGITVPVDPSRTSANVVWWISVNGGPSFPIQVPAAGGYIDDLIVGIDGQGNVVPVTLLTKLTITANLTLTSATDIVFANAASGNVVVTLPDATSTVKRFAIYKTDSSTHTVTIVTSPNTQTIDGAANLVLSTPWQAALPVSDTMNWVAALSNVADATITTTGLVKIRTAASGPHPVALTTDDLGAAGGVAALDSGSKIPVAELPIMVGDSGGGGTAGIVPAPAAGDAPAGKYLKASGAWAVPPGGGGSSSLVVATITASATLSTSTDVYLVDASGGSITATLPTAVGVTKEITVIRIDASANTVTLATSSSQTIDGVVSRSLVTQWQSLSVVSDNANWEARSAFYPSPLTTDGDLALLHGGALIRAILGTGMAYSVAGGVATITASGGGGGTSHWEPLTDGAGNLIFVGGDVVCVPVS